MAKVKFSFSPDLLTIHRKMCNFSQTQIGELVGVSAMTISKWERNKIPPSQKYINKLAKVLRTKPARLVLRDLEERAKTLGK